MMMCHWSSRVAFTIALRKIFFSTSDNPRYRTTAPSTHANGTGFCHREGFDVVRGFTVGNADPLDPSRFDLFLVFTGEATLNVSQVQDAQGVFFQRLAVDPFTKYVHGLDAGSGHAWVDDTGLHVWILCFRIGGLGVMVWMMVLTMRGSMTTFCTYGPRASAMESSTLALSVTRLVSFFTPSRAHFISRQAGTCSTSVHGVGTIGKSDSFMTLATSSCRGYPG